MEEEEEEEEEEVQVSPKKPLDERDWDTSRVFIVSSPSSLKDSGLSRLDRFIESHLTPNTLSRIGWGDKIYGTHNFFHSVQNSLGDPVGSLAHYLRPVDAALRFPSGEILHLSEREADQILEKFWGIRTSGKTEKGLLLFHVTFARSGADEKITASRSDWMTFARSDEDKPVFSPQLLALFNGRETRRSQRTLEIPEDLLTELQLFAGETSYGTSSRQDNLQQTINGNRSGTPASGEPEHIVDMRGCSHLLPYSDLEKICKSVARENEDSYFVGSLRL